jgi:hypothetical protein
MPSASVARNTDKVFGLVFLITHCGDHVIEGDGRPLNIPHRAKEKRIGCARARKEGTLLRHVMRRLKVA